LLLSSFSFQELPAFFIFAFLKVLNSTFLFQEHPAVMILVFRNVVNSSFSFQELPAGAAGEEEDDEDEPALHPPLCLRPAGHPRRDTGQWIHHQNTLNFICQGIFTAISS